MFRKLEKPDLESSQIHYSRRTKIAKVFGRINATN